MAYHLCLFHTSKEKNPKDWITYAQKLIVFFIFNKYLILMPPEEPDGTEWKFQRSPVLISHTHLHEPSSLLERKEWKIMNHKTTKALTLLPLFLSAKRHSRLQPCHLCFKTRFNERCKFNTVKTQRLCHAALSWRRKNSTIVKQTVEKVRYWMEKSNRKEIHRGSQKVFL